MMILFQVTNLPAAETLLMSIPESAGLLVFGVALTAVAVGIRAILARRENRDYSVTEDIR